MEDIVLALSLFCLLSVAHGQAVVEQAEDGNSGKISFSTPNLSDEESHSPWMPYELRCDACRAIAYQVRISTLFTLN